MRRSHLARNLVENAKAGTLADAGVYRAISGLAIPIEEGGLRVDGTVYAWAFGDGEVRFAIRDEGGKIDLNGASVELLHGLFRSIGLDEQEAADMPHQAKDTPFEMIEELLQVQGMTGELYLRLRPSLTVYTGEGIPDRDTAPPDVLAALSAVDSEEFEQDMHSTRLFHADRSLCAWIGVSPVARK